MTTILQGFIRDESGVTAIEYALIAALVAMAAFGAMGSLARVVVQMFTMVESNYPDIQ